MVRLFLIRHGEATGNRDGVIMGQSDNPLTDRGREQIARVSIALATQSIAEIYASPLQRAWLTAQGIASNRDIQINPMNELKEMHVGLASGLSWDEITAQWPEFARQYTSEHVGVTVRWPGGESGGDVRDRTARALAGILQRHLSGPASEEMRADEIKTIALVGHGGSLAWILSHLQKARLDAWPSNSRLTHCAITEMVVHSAEAPAEIVRLNDETHLTQRP